jgi:tetratricopeptide (TPR) repeat protein
MVAADSKAKLLQEAEKYVLNGKVPQAIGEYLKIVKLDPDDVLILNTIGDLYLRQKQISEASKYFSRVAESYARNNFFLKALAVYKKILSADPNNLETNATMASLYAKQGLSMDARNQYLKIAALLENAGKSKEILEIFEKIVELDPSNVTIQQKLAELYYAAGDDKQAHTCWTAAARAQIKTGDVAGAMASTRRAIESDPLDVKAIGGLLECCRKSGDFSPVLDQLKKSIHMAPQNLDMREMLGQAYMEINDLEMAAKAFQSVFSMDESRYEGFFAVAQAMINKDDCDQAANILDTIIPILITRRETERAAELFGQILQRHPKHIFTLNKLAAIYSATGDQSQYLETLDKIADHYMEINSPAEALEYLEKIIQANPESEKYRELHQQAFTEAYPDTPYIPPEVPPEAVAAPNPIPGPNQREVAAGETSPEIVEADLLLNYGLKEKALKLLQSLEIREPGNKDIRIRLMHLYKADNKYAEAAKQCLLLAALCRMSKNEEDAQTYIAEAKQMAPDMDEYAQDLMEYARLNGIFSESATNTARQDEPLKSDGEVDLSADLMDIFFAGGQDAGIGEDSGLQQTPEISEESAIEDYAEEMQQTPARSPQEQLQEVDFYIRLGFHDEALAKLKEIAKLNPDNPELAARYQKLGNVEPDSTAGTPTKAEAPVFDASAGFHAPEETDNHQRWESDDTLSGFVLLDPGPTQPEQNQDPLSAATFPSAESFRAWSSEEPQISTVIPLASDKSDFHANEMFADLMDDAGGAADADVSIDSFENHFSLGTAYREMELLEEAIKEFESALKAAHAQNDAKRTIQCCGMLSTCFLKKGMSRSALRWCQTGLGMTDNSSHEAMALRYDMGVAHSMSGSNEQALECFDRIFSMDPSYRDVAQRIDEIKSGSNKHAP